MQEQSLPIQQFTILEKFSNTRQKLRRIPTILRRLQQRGADANHPYNIYQTDSPRIDLNISADSVLGQLSPAMDGSNERRIAKPQTGPYVSAIFVHAGAGYHSTTNEHIHLGACNEYATYVN